MSSFVGRPRASCDLQSKAQGNYFSAADDFALKKIKLISLLVCLNSFLGTGWKDPLKDAQNQNKQWDLHKNAGLFTGGHGFLPHSSHCFYLREVGPFLANYLGLHGNSRGLGAGDERKTIT